MTVTLKPAPRLPDARVPADWGRWAVQIGQWLTESLNTILTQDTDVSAVNTRVDATETDITALESAVAGRVLGPASATPYVLALFSAATGKAITDAGVQDLNGAGAVNLTTLITKWGTTAADAGTLADGGQGQIKIIFMDADGGDGTLTPTNLGGATTITFNDVGDAVILMFIGSDWWVLANQGCTVA